MAMSERQALDMWRQTVCASVRADSPDLTARQQAILMTISLTRGPHTVRGLAETLELAKPAITRALDTLERHELVKRVRDHKDLRNVFLERTPEGARMLRSLAVMIIDAETGSPVSNRETDSDNSQVA
ncbi:MAG: MarR family transcriptional regulator [Hyphomonadaceae bacterium]